MYQVKNLAVALMMRKQMKKMKKRIVRYNLRKMKKMKKRTVR